MTGRGVRALGAIIAGVLSLASGLAMTLPTFWSNTLLTRLSIATSEFPWVPAALGMGAVQLSRRAHLKAGGWLGLAGTALALRPLLRLIGINARLDAAMDAGFGQGWAERIPVEATPRMIRSRFAIMDTAMRRPAAGRLVRLQVDVAYGQVGDTRLLGDLYRPAEGDGPFPVVIHIHGGSWEGGSKGDFFRPQCRWIAHQGYVVFNIDYRVSPQVLWPEHLEDVQRAIRWIRENAAALNIDPGRIALIGKSAGAHLALMAAFTGADETAVQAVIAVYPPTDLILLQHTVIRPLRYWLGKSLDEDPMLYVQASPYHAARRGVPPTLLAHGGNDSLVIEQHSQVLYQKLRGLGAPAAYLRYPWARHGFDFSMFALGGHLLQYDVDRFLAWALRPGRN